MPSFAARPAFFAAAACPRLRRMVKAASVSPPASSSAFLHSIIGAPLISRNFFTNSAGILIAYLILPRRKHAARVTALLAAGRAANYSRPAPPERGPPNFLLIPGLPLKPH